MLCAPAAQVLSWSPATRDSALNRLRLEIRRYADDMQRLGIEGRPPVPPLASPTLASEPTSASADTEVLVVGEAGVGKAALVLRLRALAAEAPSAVHVGQSSLRSDGTAARWGLRSRTGAAEPPRHAQARRARPPAPAAGALRCRRAYRRGSAW